MASGIGERKADHLDLCATDAVAFRETTTMLECVRLLHQSLPELSLDEIDLGTSLLGKRLRAPLVIAGMTGGHERAREINRGLAALAEARGYAFGVGSQRAMHLDDALADTFEVREVAPGALLLGNLGVVQAKELSTARVRELVRRIGADALCVHLNPAMELIQAGGDRDFRGALETLRRLAGELDVPVVAKETGNGLSRSTIAKLASVGIRTVDTSGAGGTSWVGVETLRAASDAAALGRALWDWGVPTAVSVAYARERGLDAIATGGIGSGLDVARALALGARAAGVARGAYRAYVDGGTEGATRHFEGIERELRSVMLLTGSRTPRDLADAEKVVVAPLRDFLAP